jgi:methyl-accepting chemotaxis protein
VGLFTAEHIVTIFVAIFGGGSILHTLIKNKKMDIVENSSDKVDAMYENIELLNKHINSRTMPLRDDIDDIKNSMQNLTNVVFQISKKSDDIMTYLLNKKE